MLIHSATIITFDEHNPILADGAVRIDGSIIEAVGGSADLLTRYPADERWDAHGLILMPGQLCAHTHFYGAFARGMYIPGPPPKDFPEILERLWWRLDKALDLAGVRCSAQVCLVDAIRNGATTLIDHHASQRAIDGSLDAIAEAVDQSGLRAVLCYEVTDRDGPSAAQAGIRENDRFIKKLARGGGWGTGNSHSPPPTPHPPDGLPPPLAYTPA
jgi:cytosine/adenosine deaminase-related metal-dependent hydrolase